MRCHQTLIHWTLRACAFGSKVVVDTGYRYGQEGHGLAMTLCCTAVLRSTTQGGTTSPPWPADYSSYFSMNGGAQTSLTTTEELCGRSRGHYGDILLVDEWKWPPVSCWG